MFKKKRKKKGGGNIGSCPPVDYLSEKYSHNHLVKVNIFNMSLSFDRKFDIDFFFNLYIYILFLYCLF